MMKSGPLVWIDCEMTGVDAFNDHILELCCILTDRDLNVIDQNGFEAVIHYPKETLDKMGPWCIENHTKTGLVQKVIDSQTTLEQAQAGLLEYLQKHINQPHRGVLAGNSVHFDRFFLMREFPEVINYLNYRLVDVSSIHEIGKRHNPRLMMQRPDKKYQHSAREDIFESIAELKWYYKHYLVSPVPIA